MPEELLAQGRRAVELARRAGADDVVAGVSWKRGLEYEWREGRLDKVQESISRRLGLALHVDGRYSSHGTNDLDPRRLLRFVEEAVAMTRFLEPDPHRRITPPELYEGRADVDLDLVDHGIDELDREQRVDWCRTVCDRASAGDFVLTATTGVSDGRVRSARVSSNGFEGTFESTGVWLGGKVSASDGEKRPEAGYGAYALHRADLLPAETIGAEILTRARRRLGAEKVSSRTATMVLDPEAGPGFLRRLLGTLSAGAVQQQRSYLAGRLGDPIASPVLTMTDDPLRARGVASRLFDGEGIAAHPRGVIEKGVLRSYYVDTYYGRKLGWSPTSGSSSNIVFEHGPRGLAEIVKDIPEGIYVTRWLGGNADMTTGDFSFGVQGHLIEKGAIGRPITGMNVTGNYAHVLLGLVEVGNDPVPWSGFRSPTLVFEGVQFSGR